MEDLNNDGKQDMLVYVAQYPYFCGKEGCTFLILIENREGIGIKYLKQLAMKTFTYPSTALMATTILSLVMKVYMYGMEKIIR